MNAIQKRPVLAGTAFASAFALALLWAFPHFSNYRTVTTGRIAGVAYDSCSPHHRVFERFEPRDAAEPPLGTDPKTGLPRDLRAREIEVGMSLRPSSPGGVGNVFGTAPFNTGLRLEYSAGNALTLIIGAHNAAGYSTFALSNDIKPGRWHSFHMTIDRLDAIAVDVDGATKINLTLPGLAFQISDVTIGSGYSKQRPFSGEIKNAAIAYGIYERNPNADDLSIDLEAASVLGLIVSLYFLIGPESWSKLRWSWRGRAPWSRVAKPPQIRVAPLRDLERNERGRALRYLWPLPDDNEAMLVLETREASQRALEALAKRVRALPEPRAEVEYTWQLSDGVVARLQFGGSYPPTRRAIEKLADYVRDLASFVGS